MPHAEYASCRGSRIGSGSITHKYGADVGLRDIGANSGFDPGNGEAQLDAAAGKQKKNFRALWENASEANVLLRAMANENRLMILCLLAEDERSVGEIESMTGARQPTVSQQLARLRADGLVESRRDGKTIHYSLICDRTRQILELLDELCTPDSEILGLSDTGGRSALRR